MKQRLSACFILAGFILTLILVASLATQADEGKVNQVFIAIGLQTTRDLRQLLRRRHEGMAAATYTDAMRFLDRAERGLTQMNAIATSSDGAHP